MTCPLFGQGNPSRLQNSRPGSLLWSLWQWRGMFFLSSRMMVMSCSRLFCVVVLQSQLQSSLKCEVAGGEVRPIQCGSWVWHCGNSKVSQFSDGTFKLRTRPKDGRQGELKLPGCTFEPPVVSLTASSVNCIHFILPSVAAHGVHVV
jgi:hypothetical protein